MTLEARVNAAKLVIILAALPVILYLYACLIVSGHFEDISGNYGKQMLDIAENYHPDDRLAREECEADRYQAAQNAATAVFRDHAFNILFMTREWNRDFLAEQPPCTRKEPKP